MSMDYSKRCLIIILFFSTFLLLVSTACSKIPPQTQKQKIITLEIWNFYNSNQKIAFDNKVKLFNETIGKDFGIYVKTLGLGSIKEVAEEILNSCNEKVGARNKPHIVALYGETAYKLNKHNHLLALDSYFTQDERSLFVDSFIEEGRLYDNGTLMILPLLKSTQLFYYNKTAWDAFYKAKNISISDINTMEDLVNVAGIYYNWTDSLTPTIPNDGKALYGRDSMDNYILFGLYQLGHPLTQDIQSIDKNSFKILWDNYYIPYIKGWFLSNLRYRTDDLKMGKIIALTGSSVAINFFSTQVIHPDNTSENIEIGVYKDFLFKNAVHDAVIQQGAGLAVINNSKKENDAAVFFLKWLMHSDILTDLAITSSYTPSLKKELQFNTLQQTLLRNNITAPHKIEAAQLAAQVLLSKQTFAPKPFEKSYQLRSLFINTLSDYAKKDRIIVQERLAQGMSLTEALGNFTSEHYFNDWFTTVSAKIITIMQE